MRDTEDQRAVVHVPVSHRSLPAVPQPEAGKGQREESGSVVTPPVGLPTTYKIDGFRGIGRETDTVVSVTLFAGTLCFVLFFCWTTARINSDLVRFASQSI
ncbi:hypothetical protein ACOMHN_035947 [Nucella lapillus]